MKPLAISIPEAAKLLGISRNLAYELVKQKKLPSFQVSERRIVVPYSALEEMLSGGVYIENQRY